MRGGPGQETAGSRGRDPQLGTAKQSSAAPQVPEVTFISEPSPGPCQSCAARCPRLSRALPAPDTNSKVLEHSVPATPRFQSSWPRAQTCRAPRTGGDFGHGFPGFSSSISSPAVGETGLQSLLAWVLVDSLKELPREESPKDKTGGAAVPSQRCALPEVVSQEPPAACIPRYKRETPRETPAPQGREPPGGVSGSAACSRNTTLRQQQGSQGLSKSSSTKKQAQMFLCHEQSTGEQRGAGRGEPPCCRRSASVRSLQA